MIRLPTLAFPFAILVCLVCPLQTPRGAETNSAAKLARRYACTPCPYPVDDRGHSPVDKALAPADAREEMMADDAEGSLHPYVLKVIAGYPLDGSLPYHCPARSATDVSTCFTVPAAFRAE